MAAMTNSGVTELQGPIAYITGEYPRATDTFIQREVHGLRRHGLDVRTYSVRRTNIEHLVGPEQREEAAQTFYVLPAAQSPLNLLRCHVQAIWSRPASYFASLLLAVRTSPPGLPAFIYQLFYFLEAIVLADDMKRQGVIHLHNHIATASCTVAMLASKASGIPFSFTMHGPDIFFEPIRWRIDEKMAQASFVACISDFCRSQAMIFADQEHWHKLHIVHCGIEPARYQSSARFETKRTSSTAPCELLFVGRLAGVKGVPVLFEALRSLRASSSQVHLTLIGDGPERKALEEKARTMGLQECVTFAGYQSQAEVAQALSKTDIFVLPSFAEGVPVVLMEALASSVPVITSRIAGIPELVEDQVNGLLIPPGDPGALADAIQELASNADVREQYGQAGRAKVQEQYNIEHETKWLAHLLTSYLAKAESLPVRPGAPKLATKFTKIPDAIGT